MSTDNFDNIDELFRGQLDGHATPPGEDLWARLQADSPPAETAVETSPVDARFREALARHATPPARVLWERLEDEHLRPRQRRAAAWWPMALAAAVALLLVAGGVLWLGTPFGRLQPGAVATHHSPPRVLAPNNQSPNQNAVGADAVATLATPDATENIGAMGAKNREHRAMGSTLPKNSTAQATRLATLASTAPKANAAFPGTRRALHLSVARPQDAAAESAQVVAHTTGQPAAADERQPAPVVAQALVSAPEIVPAAAAPVLNGAAELITVDVRNGAAPALRPAQSATAAVAPESRPRLGGRLLQQVNHLARGERVSLAEVTGLPEHLTLHATVAGRSISKSIQL